jgi:peroxiredoxin Q/BCP
MAKKKVAKKKAAKPAKKKTAKKSAKKKAAPKASKKKAAKKAAKKAKPAKKKTAKKASAKKKAAPKKKAAKKSSAKKSSAKKSAKKVVLKKGAKVVVPKPIIKKKAKKKSAISNLTSAVGDFVKTAYETVVEKVNPSHNEPVNDTANHDAGNDNSNSNNSNDDNGQDNTEESSEDKSEEEEPFVPHSTGLIEGSIAPYFEGKDQDGNTVRSSDFIGKTLVLYFYPKDFTEGCTAESCSLRDEYKYLNDNNYAVVGVSADDIDSHKRFADEHRLPFPLIADVDRKIINDYDVWGWKELAGNRYEGIVRTTFIIDPDGIIKKIITKVDNANAAKQILSFA